MKEQHDINKKFKLAYDKIKEAKNILLISHVKPDGDALASICACAEILTGFNKKFFAFSHDEPPRQYNFLPHIEKICTRRDELDFASFDTILVLDCGSLSRTKLAEEISERKKEQYVIEFDHHPKMDDYSDLEIRLTENSSTAEVLYDFIKENNIKLNKNIANCVLAGILTDTGNFLYPSTTDKTIRIASEMLKFGARFPIILENTRRNKSLSGMKFWGKAINNLKINKRYNLAYTVLTHEDIAKDDIADEDLDDIAGFLSNLYGVSGLLVLREAEAGKVKGSLRTTAPDIDISKLAVKLGGGGHPKASGFALDGNIEKIEGGWRVV